MFLDFLARLFFFFTGVQDPDQTKKRRLKQLAKELGRNRHARFYNPKYEESTAALANFFYDIYKIVAPAQIFLQNATKSNLLKQIVIESFLDKNLGEARERLTTAFIEEWAKTAGIKDIAKTINDDIVVFASAFDSARIKAIDHCYVNILSMARFVAFDFFALLKKYNSNITERDFSCQPVFSNVQGSHLSDEIKDFLEISFMIDTEQEWKHILQILKIYRNGVTVVSYEQWSKVLYLLKDIRRSGILELMLRHIEKNPGWQFKPKIRRAHIAEKYLEEKQMEIRAAMEKIAIAQKKAQRDELVSAVFGSADIQRSQYYTEKDGEIYLRKNFDGFLYAAAINYLMAFLLDMFRLEFRSICDLLLIRGKWIVSDFANEASEHFHLLMEHGDKLIAFDETFSVMGMNGSRLKTSIGRTVQDKNQRHFITHILGNANEEALDLINTGVRSIMVLDRSLGAMLEDRQKLVHNLIMNWQELENVSTIPLYQRLSNACKKISAFIQLMTFLARNEEELVL
jgi:hypothetical protein